MGILIISMITASSRTQLYFFLTIFLGIGVLMLFILLPYLSPLALAGALAIVFSPLHEKVKSVIPYPGLAAFITLLAVVLLFLVPLIFFGTLIVREAVHIYTALQDNRISDIHAFILNIQDNIQHIIPAGWGTLDLSSMVRSMLGWAVANLSNVFTNIIQGILSIALSLFMLYFFFKDGTELRKFLIIHSPLSDTYDRKILDRMEQAVNSVLRGALLIAMIQGILAGVGFSVFGIPSAALWGGVTVIAALVPTVGTALVFIPAILFLLTTGHTDAAIGLAIWGALAVGMIDNFLGPKLIGSRIHLHPLVIMLSVLGGLGVFGPIGFLLGPLVFSIFFVMLDIYVNISKGESPTAPH
jgi:predicted PurR-regulated permease PerM